MTWLPPKTHNIFPGCPRSSQASDPRKIKEKGVGAKYDPSFPQRLTKCPT